MTPEYLEHLANLADPDELWRLPPFDQMDLPPDKRAKLDAGVALRRYASDVRYLQELRVNHPGKSLLITPLSPNGTARKTVPTPKAHVRLVHDFNPQSR